MFERVVKSKLALKGMTLKDLAEAIGENYNSVYDVVHGKWGHERGVVAIRILEKISRFLEVDLSEEGEYKDY